MTVLPVTTFRAMGTDVELLGLPALPLHVVDQVEARFLEVEAALSRFRPDSDLSRLNRSGGHAFQASPLLLTVLRAALDAAARSDGAFDPTLIDAVEAAGYDRSFYHMHGVGKASAALPRGRYSDVEIAHSGCIFLHNGVRVDLGGFAKGWTVDTCEELMVRCESWVINAGGDLLARGPGPTGEGWLVGIEDPFDTSRDVGVILVRDAAIATTSRMRRRWITASGPAHHIIDPRTGRPADTGLASVCVIASTAAEAEVLAKTLFLLGPRAGPRAVASGLAAGAVFIRDDGLDIWAGCATGLRVA